MKTDIHQQVTDTVIEMIESGVNGSSWKCPWVGQAMPINRVTGHAYRGVNVLMLWLTASARDYPTNLWASYKQWQQIGGQVRHGDDPKHRRSKEAGEDDGCEEPRGSRDHQGYGGPPNTTRDLFSYWTHRSSRVEPQGARPPTVYVVLAVPAGVSEVRGRLELAGPGSAQ